MARRTDYEYYTLAVPKNSELYSAIQDEVNRRDSTQPSATIRDMLNEYISTRDIRAMLAVSVEDIRTLIQEQSGASLDEIRTLLRQELAGVSVSANTAKALDVHEPTSATNAAEADAAWPD